MFNHKKIFAALLLAPLFVGCVVNGDDDDGAGTDTDVTTDPTMTTADPTTDPTMTTADPTTDPTMTTADPTTDTDPTGDTGVDTGVETSAGSTDTGTGDGGFCQQMCAADEDCCAEGTEKFCPGEYPFNVTCTEGVCEYGGCTGDADCADIAGTTCHDVGGFPSCVPLCTGDGAKECIEGETCTGMTDDGDTYCVFEAEPCTEDADCFDFGVCNTDTGVCECSDATQCPKGYECSAG